jgi:hypothetical protein
MNILKSNYVQTGTQVLQISNTYKKYNTLFLWHKEKLIYRHSELSINILQYREIPARGLF